MSPITTEVRPVEGGSMIDLSGFASRIATDGWLATPAPRTPQIIRRVILDAIERVRSGDAWGAQDAFRAAPFDRQPAVIAHLKDLGFYPRDFVTVTPDGPEELFVFAIDRMIAGSSVIFPEPPEHRPTCEDRFEVSRVGELEWFGFRLAINGEPVVGSPEHTEEERAAVARGHAAGTKVYGDDLYSDPEYAAWSDDFRRRQVDAMNGPNYGFEPSFEE